MLNRFITYIRAIATRRRVDAETDDELRFHLEHEIAEHVSRGMSATEARRVALRDLGGLTQTIEAVREVRMTWIDVVRQDSLLAWRRFFSERGTVAAAVLTCALGIGGTTATYSVVYGVLLRPLPVADEGSLVAVYRTSPVTAAGYYSYPAFEAMRRSGAFDDVAATSPLQLDLTGDPGAERIDATSVSDTFFQMLGIHASLGRTFTDADRDAPEMRVVISDSLWRGRFGADPGIVGRTLTAVPASAVIVGVLPPGVERAFGNVDAWLPIARATDPAMLTSPGYLIVRPIGRLAHGVSADDTRSRLAAISIADEDSPGRESGVRLVSLRDDIVPQRIERLLLVVFAVVLLTWAVVCANLSLLSIERGARRGRELAVRLALGASRSRVFAQLLIESTWLAVAGGALGVGLAFWAVQLFVAAGPPVLFDTNAIRVDGPVLAFALALTMLTAVLSGIAPAVRASRPRTPLIARESRTIRSTRLSHALIVSQIAVALVVLAGASLLVKSLLRMQQVDLGFDSARLLTAGLILPPSRYGNWTADNTRYIDAQRRLLERLAAIPGVDKAAIGTPVFTPGVDGRISIQLDDRRSFLNGEPDHYALAPGSHYVGPGYMRFHGIPVVAGREFHEDDRVSTPHGVLINEAMARLYWPDDDPLGKRVNFGRRRNWTTYEEPWATVIGVVADVRHGGVDLPVKPEVYRAQFQHPRPMFEIALRTSIPPEGVMRAVREVVRAFDPDLPLFDLRTTAGVVAETTATARYSSALLSVLAGVAVLLCGVGIFSLLAGSVAARRREIAIRMALGAAPRRMVAAVMARVVILLTVGASIGVTAALLAARTLSGLLYDVAPLDPVSHSIGIVVLVVAGMAAAWIPARRASTVNPVVALREE